MPSTAKVAAVYHKLAAKQTKLAVVLVVGPRLPRKIPLIGWRLHWNAIWHHRLAMEIACQMKEGKDQMTATMEVMQAHQSELQKLMQK